jgi:DNA (cytosine-5)-methyltransferase 1
MKYLSVCSGIEAATVAWHTLGWEPLAFSEIEKFPRKVLEYHYPDTLLHGDFTLLREQDWIKDADILVGGTPCQAFSVAGLRNSLDDDRGNLTLEFVRLANAIDDLRHTGDGTIIVWENVPGVLSVKDNAFGCFLGAIVGNDAPLVPTGGKWTNAGMVVGPKRRATWRILDAQYFGVAQRRRRVFVVASARDGFDPAEVLFEREGLRRDSPPSREQRKDVTGPITAGITKGLRGTEGIDSNWAVVQPITQYGNVAGTLSARHDSSPCADRGQNMVAQPVYLGNAEGGALEKPFLTCHNTGGTAGISNQTPLVAQPMATSFYANEGSHGMGDNTEVSVTIKVGLKNPVAVSTAMLVRRLTPRECERLQGFPDDYTAIPGAADGPRYKALGNSMAVPVMNWIGKRILKNIEK